MKKSLAITLIAVFAVLTVAFCTLYFVSNANQKQDIAYLQSELKASREKNEALAAGMEEREAQIRELNTNLEKKETELTDVSAELAVKNAELESISADLADKETELESVSADLTGKETELERISAELAGKMAELESASAELASKEEVLESVTAELASRDAELESVTAELESTDTELEIVSAELTNRNAELESKTAEAEELAAQVGSLTEQIAALQESSIPAVPDKPGVYDSTKFFLQALEDAGVKYSYLGNDSDGNDSISSNWTLDDFQIDVTVYFSDNEHMAIRVNNIIEFSYGNLTSALTVCSYCNYFYKYASFYIDDTGNTITVSEDILLSEPATAGTVGYQLFRTMVNIIDNCEDDLLSCAS